MAAPFTTRDGHVTLESQDWHSVCHHLRIAAARYIDDAAAMEEAKQPRIAETFREQARQAQTLADALEEMV